MTELAPASTILATPKSPALWDDASTLTSRSNWSSGRSEETLASLGWKSRPRQSDCREVLSSNRFMANPSPSIYVHGTRCTCKPSSHNKSKTDDDILAERILAASDAHRSQKKRANQRKRQSTSLITRIFASAVSNPDPYKVADLCFGCSALDIAKVTRHLFDENTPINSTNHVGVTPLTAALRAINPQLRPQSHLAMISFLLDCGADPNGTSDVSSMPITLPGPHHSSISDDPRMMDACATQMTGDTIFGPVVLRDGTMSVLSVAVSLDLPDAVRMLLNRGAAVDGPLTSIPVMPTRFAGHGLTALHVAAFEDKAACMEILLEHGGANVSTTFDACRAVDWLKNVPKRQRDRQYWTKEITALHVAADSPKCAELLLRYGADPTARDNFGRTPLHWAMVSGNTEVVKLLLAAGTNPDVMDEDGATPLSELVTRLECGDSRQGHPKIARMLLTCGADLDLRYPQSVSLRERLLKMDKWRGVYEPIFEAVDVLR